jgi:two-component system, LytTR family, sensor kinase
MNGKTVIRKWLLSFGVCTVFGMLVAVQLYLYYERFYTEKGITFFETLAYALPEWFLWALLGPVIYIMARRFPVDRATWKRHLPLHGIISLIYPFVHVIMSSFLVWMISDMVRQKLNFSRHLEFELLTSYQFNMIIYWGIAGIGFTIGNYRKYHDASLLSVTLEKQLVQTQLQFTRAQLQTLKQQLQPHFLFNTLNTITSYMYTDVALANRMIASLSRLLRMIIEFAGCEEMTMRSELEFMEKYFEIETVRFQDRLKVQFTVDPQTMTALVPVFILQPLVENAVCHGIAKRSTPGRIIIHAHKDDHTLTVSVTDNGAGIPHLHTEEFKQGLGLSTTVTRLNQLYGSAASVEMMNLPAGGFEIRFSIPFHNSPWIKDNRPVTGEPPEAQV